MSAQDGAPGADQKPAAFYRAALRSLNESGADYLVGGAFAMARLTGIAARTKDLDLFVRRRDRTRVLRVLAAAGCRTSTPYPHWLAKAEHPAGLIDVIFDSGNAQLPVDDEWFTHALPARVLGVRVRLAPVEEMLCSKAFIMERERFDGADVIHLLRAAADRLDWQRLLRRFGAHWPVLLSHLILFSYAYPGERHRVPDAVVEELVQRWRDIPPATGRERKLCRGGMLSRAQYLAALADWGYQDARRPPYGNMSGQDLRTWTEAAAQAAPPQRQGQGTPTQLTTGASPRRRDTGARGVN
ncbi:MAG: hypothetical protein AB7V27_15105 [Candidatus Binatia bacterium]